MFQILTGVREKAKVTNPLSEALGFGIRFIPLPSPSVRLSICLSLSLIQSSNKLWQQSAMYRSQRGCREQRLWKTRVPSITLAATHTDPIWIWELSCGHYVHRNRHCTISHYRPFQLEISRSVHRCWITAFLVMHKVHLVAAVIRENWPTEHLLATKQVTSSSMNGVWDAPGSDADLSKFWFPPNWRYLLGLYRHHKTDFVISLFPNKMECLS